jgi:hypothetical protein
MELSGQLHSPAALPPGKSPFYPLDRRLGGIQSRSQRGGEEKKKLEMCLPIRVLINVISYRNPGKKYNVLLCTNPLELC